MNLKVSCGGRILQIIEEKEINRLRYPKAIIIEELNGTTHIIYQGKELKYRELIAKDRRVGDWVGRGCLEVRKIA